MLLLVRLCLNFLLCDKFKKNNHFRTNSRPDVVQLTPIYDEQDSKCSSKAIVSSISKDRLRNTAIVLAEEQFTGQVLRCDVIVDVIFQLDIVTTTRELFMEEAPEAFEVRAYDEQGNEFTTLENVEFDWILTSPGNIDVLRFMTFKDSPYETPKSIELFEKEGKRGHIVLLEGVKTGSAKVTVNLAYPEYSNVKTAEVSLMVVANLMIDPADVYMLRGDVIQYKIIQVKHGRLEQIDLSSSQYYLQVENEDIGLMKSGQFIGLREGRTRVILHDRNVDRKNEGELRLPSSQVTVTFPSRMSLSIAPNHNWAVLLNEKHDIIVELYAKNDHKMYIGSGVLFETTVDESLFPVAAMSKNQSWFTGIARQEGSARVTSKLISITNAIHGRTVLDPTLSVVNEILIFPPIELEPPEAVFPWDPKVPPKYDLQMRASGGDGKFIWSSSNHSVGSVSQLGLARTYAVGQYEICASMCRNTNNKKCSKFYVIPPTKLEIVEYVMENEIGSPIFLHVALFAQRPGSDVTVPFTKCQKLTFKVKPSEVNFIYNETAETENVGISCKPVAVVGLGTTTAKITVSYVAEGKKLEDSVTVSAYRKLQPLYPHLGESVLALGTSRNIVFEGGPRAWSGRSTEHSRRIDSTNKESLTVVDTTEEYRDASCDSDMYVVNVFCKEVGRSEVTLTVSNKPLFPNCRHQASVSTVIVHCSPPHDMSLTPEIKSTGSEACPMDLSAEKVVVQCYSDIIIDVVVKDEEGRHFDNVTSLEFDWYLTPVILGSDVRYQHVLPKNFTYEKVLLPKGQIQAVIPQKQAGMLDVTAKIIGYKREMMIGVKEESLRHLVQSKISLYLVDETIIAPNITSVYNHPENKFYISVKQGSGFYEMVMSANDIADVKYIESKRQLEVTPQATGELKVVLKDLCLRSNPASIIIRIVSVAAVKVEVSDRVQIGKTLKAVVKFYDDAENVMPLPNLEYLDLRYVIEDDIISIKQLEENPSEPWPMGEIHYLVRGLQLGETQLVFAAGRGPREVVSKPVTIQVFPPMKLLPRNTTLFIGAELQLTVQGGPQPDINLEYLVQFENVIEVSQSGLVKALSLGLTKVIGRSIGICPYTNEKMIHGQDIIDVTVIPLTGIKIMTPLTRFMQGAEVPAWFTGLPESLSPILLGSVKPPFHVSWITEECEDVIDVNSVFRDIGVRYNPEEEITIHLKGKKPGWCNLRLNVTVPGATAGLKLKEILFTTSVEIEVFEELVLLQPNICGQNILMAPYSTLQLETNLEGRYTLTYSLQDEHFTYDKSAIPNTAVTVSDTGLLQSYGIIGRVMVVITAADDHGLKQAVTVVVQIKPIHYMMASVQTDWLIKSLPVNYIPLGAEIKFIISYHDNAGAVFTAANVDLRFRSNRFDLVEMKRSSINQIITYTVKPGSTVIKMWADGVSKTVDYVNIISDRILSPSDETFNIGDVFCLRSPVVDKYFMHGRWHTEHPDIIIVDPETGVGQVVTSSATVGSVFYSLTPAVKVRFNIESVKVVTVKYDKNRVVSDQSHIEIPFVMTNFKDRYTKTSNLIAGWPCQGEVERHIKHYPFKCEIVFSNEDYDIDNVFNVVPGFNADLGLFTCNIHRIDDVSPITSTIDSNITFVVAVNNGIESDPVDLLFKPAVYISDEDLELSDQRLDANLIVTGLTSVLKQVKVTPVDGNLLIVEEPIFINPTTVSFKIRLIDYHWKFNDLDFSLSVTVESKITSQNVKVLIRTNLGQDFNSRSLCMSQHLGSPAGNFFYENRHAFIIIFSMLILFFLTVYAYSNYIQPVINVNVGPRPPSGFPCPPGMLNKLTYF